MADIRIAQPRTNRLWLWVGILALVAVVVWASVYVFGDPTNPAQQPQVGDQAGFGDQRAPLIPPEPTPFDSLAPPQTRDLGRLVRLDGWAETAARANALWVRTPAGYRLLVRFEPPPAAGALQRFFPGAAVHVNGYLGKISRAEFEVWMDTLGVAIPRPPPGTKFGDLPSPAFERVDSLFIKTFYISVRPRGLGVPPASAADSTR